MGKSRREGTCPGRLRPGTAAAVIAVALLSGCSVGEDYQRPEVAVPAAWAESAEPVWPDVDWWRRFNSPVLETLMRRAMDGNFDLAAAMARVRQADAQVGIAGASLLPNLGASLGPTRQHQPNLSPRAAPGSKGTQSTTYNATLSASYEIDFWGKNAAMREAAEATARGSRFDERTVALTIQAGVANTYFQVLAFRDRIEVARVDIDNALGSLMAIRDRERAGLATTLDVAQQESIVAIQRAIIAPLEQQLRQNLNALALLTGQLPADAPVQGGTLAEVTEPPVMAGLPSELLARRPDVRNAESQLMAANADITAARAALFPSLQLTAQGGLTSLALTTLVQARSVLFSLAGSLTQSIFDNGLRENQVELKRARHEELLAVYRKAVLSAFLDVENALIAVRKTAEEEEAQRIAERTARRAYEISQAQLKGGIVDITSVLNTQRTLFQTHDAWLQARLAHFQATVGLFKALGGGWTEEAGEIGGAGKTNTEGTKPG
ncbi:MAG: efflux transporter outer membrane subunit [Alphaproteobacteria bacterium]